MNILLTGGTGYIASHTAVVLTAAGHHVVFYNNFCNSQPAVGRRLKTIAGAALPLIEGDLRALVLLTATLPTHQVCTVSHFADLKAVGQPVAKRIDHNSNCVRDSISLLPATRAAWVKPVMFGHGRAPM